MVSLPTFDPNQLAVHDFGEVADNYEELQDEESEPLLNRATQTRLAPGSTFKLVTAAAAIEELGYDADSQVPGGATYQLPLTSDDSGLIDNEGRDCGTDKIPFTQAMGQSCNTTFARLAVDVGADAMLDQAEAFGFNSEYLDDLSPQAESFFPENMDAAQTGQSGIGQFEVQATPLQMAMVSAGIANGGTVMRPYLVDAVPHPRARRASQDRPRGALAGGRRRDRQGADRTDGRHRHRGHRLRGRHSRLRRRRQDRYRAERSGRRPAVRLVHVLRPGRRPPGGGRGDDRERTGTERGEIAGGALGGPIAKAIMEAVIQP